MKTLKKSLLNLALGELVASCIFVVAYIIHLDFGAASLLALFFLVYILVQGALYWVFRSQFIGKEKHVFIKRTLRVLRSINLILAVLVLMLIIMLSQNKIDLVVGLLLYLFSVIEYVNYYWYRLSYGKSGFNIKLLINTGLRPSSIHKLLKRESSPN